MNQVWPFELNLLLIKILVLKLGIRQTERELNTIYYFMIFGELKEILDFTQLE